MDHEQIQGVVVKVGVSDCSIIRPQIDRAIIQIVGVPLLSYRDKICVIVRNEAGER